MKIRFTLSSKKADSESKGFHYIGETIFIIFGIAVMVFPFIVDTGHIAPAVGAFIMGLMFVIMGSVLIFDGERRRKRRQKAIETGRIYTAVVTAVHHRSKIVGNKRKRMVHGYCVECEMTDPETGEKYLLTSDYVSRKLYGSEGLEVKVYVDPDDRTNYYVDISNLK